MAQGAAVARLAIQMLQRLPDAIEAVADPDSEPAPDTSPQQHHVKNGAPPRRALATMIATATPKVTPTPKRKPKAQAQ